MLKSLENLPYIEKEIQLTFKSAGKSRFNVYNISLFIYVARFDQSSSSSFLVSIARSSVANSDSTVFVIDSNLFESNLFQDLRRFDALKRRF